MANNMIYNLYRHLVKVYGYKGDLKVEGGKLMLTFGDQQIAVAPIAVGEEAPRERMVETLPVQWTNELDD